MTPRPAPPTVRQDGARDSRVDRETSRQAPARRPDPVSRRAELAREMASRRAQAAQRRRPPTARS